MLSTTEKVPTQPHNFPKRCVLMRRRDGLCQRIVAAINGLVIASEFDLQFQLEWVNNKSMKSRFDRDYTTPNDTPEDPRSIFSDRFIEKYFVEGDDIHLPPELSSNKRQKGVNVSNRKEMLMDTKSDFERAADENTFFGLAPNKLDDELLPDFLTKCRSTVSNWMFSDTVRCLFEDVNAKVDLKDTWALHLRSGDVVYGDIRKWTSPWRGLSLTVPVTIDICRIAEKSGKKILVVGASKHEIDFVLRCCPNALAAEDVYSATVCGSSAVFRDVILMSKSEKLFAAAGSAVVQLANYLGNSDLIRVADLYSESAESDVLISALERGEIESCHNLQIAFVYYNLFILNWHKGSFDELDGYLDRAFGFDSENLAYIVLRYLNCLSFSKFKRARHFEFQFRKLAEMAEKNQGTNKRKMVNHIKFTNKFMEEFVIYIFRNGKLPVIDCRRLGRWIDRFYSNRTTST